MGAECSCKITPSKGICTWLAMGFPLGARASARIPNLPTLPLPPPGQAANREHPLRDKPGTGLTPCHGIQHGAICRPQESLPPGGGVAEKPSRQAKTDAVGGTPARRLRIDIFSILNIDRQDERDERLLHGKPARPMIRCGFADAQEYKLAVS